MAEAAGFGDDNGMGAADGLGDAVGSDRRCSFDMAMSKRIRASVSQHGANKACVLMLKCRLTTQFVVSNRVATILYSNKSIYIIEWHFEMHITRLSLKWKWGLNPH